MVQIVDAAPEVLVWHLASDSDGLPAELRAALVDPHGPAILVLTDDHPATWFEEAMHLEVDDIVCLPQPAQSLGMAVAKARASRARRSAALLAQGMTIEPRTDRGHVFTVFSTKGGSGRTVIAANLAVCFASQGLRTLLFDFDLHSGDDALVLGLSPRWTVVDLVQSHGELDPERLAGFVTRHSSGVDVLPAPSHPHEEELVTIDRLGVLLDIARRSYDAVVVDTSASFSPATLLALDRTDTLLLLGASDVPTIKSLKIALETLDLVEIDVPDTRFVMNRSGAKVGVADHDVEQTLQRAITYTLPSDRAMPIAVNRGRAVVVDNPRSRIARSLREIALSLHDAVGTQT